MVSERESKSNNSNNDNTIKFLCSYNGQILPRRGDGKLRYVGGFTRILTVDRSISFTELMVKLVELCGFSVILRCQLPDGDLDTLITVKSDEELRLVIEEYNRASSKLANPLKIRAVLSPQQSLKKVSPPPSSAPSVFDFPRSSSSGGCCSCPSCCSVGSATAGRYEARKAHSSPGGYVQRLMTMKPLISRVPHTNHWH